ncbi:MAG TPA: biotin/lipoyl-binding protein, partial [Syntrophales bacterium]
MKKWTLRGLILIVILAAGTYVTVLFLHSLSHESTDDAYVSGTIVPIAAEVKGRVGKVLVRDNQYVTAGTPLLEIIQDDYRSLLQERSEAVSRLRAEDREIRASVEEKRRLFVQS